MKNRNEPFTLRDLLYLGFDKAASIWSQFEEGLLASFSVTEDTGKDRAAGTRDVLLLAWSVLFLQSPQWIVAQALP
jgi:hypothetical protein